MERTTVAAGGHARRHPGGAAWLRCREPRPGARSRIVVFPHAGGGANGYRAWAARFPPDCEVWLAQYPGREDRTGEPLVDSMEPLADSLAAAVTEQAARWGAQPGDAGGGRGALVLFGHSMGAAVAYETARRLHEHSPGLVRLLVVSARPAPTRAPRSQAHTLPRERFVEVLRTVGGTDDAVLADDELVDYLLPVVRNDYRLIETYRPPADARLAVDILALAGENDPAASVEDVVAWAGMTTGTFDAAVFPGGHFYLRQDPAPVIAALTRRLRGLEEPAGPRDAP